jgi:hypothetical protein
MPMIQRGRPTNKVQRKRAREVFHAEHAPPATPKYLNWLEHPIGFDRSDHPPKIPRPGHHTLVLEAQIGGFTSKKVFMDGGSSLNLIYADSLRKIKIPMDNLLPTETSFHRIVLGKPTYPLWGNTPRCHLRHSGKLQEGEDRVRGCRLALAVSRHPRATSVCPIHGGTALCLS